MSEGYKPSCIIRGPVETLSGYGEMTRDIVRHVIEYDKFDVKIFGCNWGETPMNALNPEEPMDKMILDRIIPENYDINNRPDIFISVSIPTEFQPYGSKYNIGCTAGIETTQASPEWVQAMNRMDVNFVISEHSKRVFDVSKYQANGPDGKPIGIVQCEKPIEVLHNCADTYTYKKTDEKDLELTIKQILDPIPEKFNYLFVGHWLKGDIGQDRKNVGLLIKIFYELFKRKEFTDKPGLILKTSSSTYSIMDRESVMDKIKAIKTTVALEEGESLPNVYLIHGELTDDEMNSLYNHPKVKCNISLTKGEGFNRPLLEASLSGKPIITSGWSGHLDFLNPVEALLLGGTLEDVHDSSIWEGIIIKGSKWFSVDHNMVAQAMVEIFKNYKVWKTKANSLAQKNKDNFNYKKIRNDMWRLLDKYIPQVDGPTIQPKRANLNLPKLKKVDGNNKQEFKVPQLKKV